MGLSSMDRELSPGPMISQRHSTFHPQSHDFTTQTQTVQAVRRRNDLNLATAWGYSEGNGCGPAGKTLYSILKGSGFQSCFGMAAVRRVGGGWVGGTSYRLFFAPGWWTQCLVFRMSLSNDKNIEVPCTKNIGMLKIQRQWKEVVLAKTCGASTIFLNQWVRWVAHSAAVFLNQWVLWLSLIHI